MKLSRHWSCLVATILISAMPSLEVRLHAQTSVSIGSQHFTDGQALTTSQFTSAVASQPAPFNGFNGSGDAAGPNFEASWSMSFSPPAQIGEVSLTFGIYDHDSAASGNQVSLFTAAGADLTAALNAAFEAHGGGNREYNLYTLTLPSSTFATLASGSASFRLTLNGPGSGVLGSTAFNGAGLDFATLTLTPQTIPEPGSVALFCAGVAALWFCSRRR
jgi:PEP-CTERM motif